MSLFFTADLHLGHANCIKYCHRPFTDAHHMNKSIIENWNAVVQPGDDVYVVGDVSFSSPDATVSMLKSMHGNKFLVAGNHDARLRKKPEFAECFEWIKDYHELVVPDPDANGGNQHIVLCHFPMLAWNRSRYGAWMLHGHCHGNLKEPRSVKRYDCGVDPNNFVPVRYDQLKKLFRTRPDVDIDQDEEETPNPGALEQIGNAVSDAKMMTVLVGGYVTLELLEYFKCKRILKRIDDFLSIDKGSVP